MVEEIIEVVDRFREEVQEEVVDTIEMGIKTEELIEEEMIEEIVEEATTEEIIEVVITEEIIEEMTEEEISKKDSEEINEIEKMMDLLMSRKN